jgi:cytochrome P450
MTESKSPNITPSPELQGISGLFHFGKDPLAAFTEAMQKHGDVVAFSQLRGKYLLFLNPEQIEALLQHKGGELEKDFFTRDLGPLLGQGLLLSEGDFWKRQRKLMAPTFQPRELVGFGETMVTCTDEWLAKLESGALCDVHAAGMHLTLDIVVRTLFGARLEKFDEVEQALDDISTEYRLLWQTWRALLPRWVPLPSHGRLKRIRQKLDAILLDLIHKKREAPGKDLLSHLISLVDDEGKGMTDEQLRDEAMTLFLAGHETTALGFTYTFHLLATHPEVYEQVVAEVDRVLGGRAPKQSDLEQLPYTAAVVRESLRLYPPVWSMARFVTRDAEIGGVQVSAKTQVILSQWVTQRDPRWFREPERFRPERWLGDEAKSVPRFAYFPFGGGPRVCVGQHFALLELILMLARTSQSVLFEPSGEELALGPVITLRPKGPVHLKVAKRSEPGVVRESAAE